MVAKIMFKGAPVLDGDFSEDLLPGLAEKGLYKNGYVYGSFVPYKDDVSYIVGYVVDVNSEYIGVEYWVPIVANSVVKCEESDGVLSIGSQAIKDRCDKIQEQVRVLRDLADSLEEQRESIQASCPHDRVKNVPYESVYTSHTEHTCLVCGKEWCD